MASTQHRCVFVGNIPYDATEEQLVQICEEVGPVVSFRLVIDRETGKPKGYGFCEYKDEETVLSARRNLQGYEINGRQLRVGFAENDKGAERNREQGRGGPGLASNLVPDAQKSLASSGILGDSSLYQPIGLPLAATAASVMAGALGDAQISSSMPLNQNSFQNQSGLGNDSLTFYLAKMSRNQLYEVMSEMKALAKQNQALARQLLSTSSQLPKALFQAQIILGMVTPQVLQMPNIRQPSSSHLQPPLQDGQQDQHPVVLPAHQGGLIPPIKNKVQVGLLSRMPEGQLPIVSQNILIPQPPAISLQSAPPMQPRFLLPQPAQTQVPLQTALPGQPGVSTVPALRPQPITGFPVRPQMPSLMPPKALKQQMQPPRPMGAATIGNASLPALQNAALQHSLLSHPLSSQAGSFDSPLLVGGLEVISREPGSSVPIFNSNFSHDAAQAPKSMAHSNMPSSVGEQMVMVNETSEVMTVPSKVAKIENGTSASRVMVSNNTTGVGSVPSALGTGSISENRIPPSNGVQHTEQQVPQLAPEVESALLKQVMSLTSEQLSSLPPEQRQQVIQLQQMLR